MFGITLLHPPENKKIRTRDYKYIYEIIELIITNHKLIVTAVMDNDDNDYHLDEESASSSEDIPKTYERFSVCEFVVDNDDNTEEVPVQMSVKLNDIPEVDESNNDIALNMETVPVVAIDTNIAIVESISTVQSSSVALPRTFSLLETIIYWYKLLISTTRKFLSRFF